VTLSLTLPVPTATLALSVTQAPWSGLVGVPPGFADGVDDNTTYTAGDGLMLSGEQFQVGFSGSGVTPTAAHRDHHHVAAYVNEGQASSVTAGTLVDGATLAEVLDDDGVGSGLDADLLDGRHASTFAAINHNHLGQTWTGSDNPLVMTGTFGAPNYAPLVLGNTYANKGDGLYVSAVGDHGVRVGSAGGNGVYVNSAVRDGVYVSQADDDGMYIRRAGDPSATSASSEHNGFEVGGAEGNGLHVGQADMNGVHVYKVGNPSTTQNSEFSNGFQVAGAEGYGLYVGRADLSGVVGGSAGWDGVNVYSAGGVGVAVNSAGMSGVYAASSSALHYGEHFRNFASLYTRGYDNGSADIVLGGHSSADDGRIDSDPYYDGSDILLYSNDEVWVHFDENQDEESSFRVYNGANEMVFSVDENGDMTAKGNKSAVVITEDYGQRKLYAVESPEVWFEDLGAAQLVSGTVTVFIEPIFAQTVNLTETYHVFLTPLGDCPLYVAEKTAQTFTVKAMGGQTCSIAFDYRIVAKRAGYETLRLEAVAPSIAEEDE
jgi:hypothetical protein